MKCRPDPRGPDLRDLHRIPPIHYQPVMAHGMSHLHRLSGSPQASKPYSHVCPLMMAMVTGYPATRVLVCHKISLARGGDEGKVCGVKLFSFSPLFLMSSKEPNFLFFIRFEQSNEIVSSWNAVPLIYQRIYC